MRYSRLRKGRTRKKYAIFLVFAIIVFVGIYMFSAGYFGKKISQFISSIINSFDKDAETPNQDEDLLNGDIENGEKPSLPEQDEVKKITEKIIIDPAAFYSIQMNAFSTLENADTFAKEIQNKGGAGYIIQDQHYRVLAIAFLSETDAQKVREQLKEEEIDSQIYKISYPGVNMQITASKDKVDIIQSAFSLWKDEIKLIENIITELDTYNISTENAQQRILNIKNEFEKEYERLKECSASQESMVILNGLVELYQKGLDNLDKIINENSSNRIAISSKIKYTYIDMFHLFKCYLEQITKS